MTDPEIIMLRSYPERRALAQLFRYYCLILISRVLYYT